MLILLCNFILNVVMLNYFYLSILSLNLKKVKFNLKEIFYYV